MKTIKEGLYLIRDQLKSLTEKLKARKQDSYKEIRKIEKELSESLYHQQEKEQTAHFAAWDAWKFWVVGAAVVLIGYFLFQSLDIIYLILTAFIISMAIENVILFFQRRFSRGFSMLIAYVLLLIFIFLGLIIVTPFLVQQVADLITVVVDRMTLLQQHLQQDGLVATITNSNLPGALKNSLLQGLEDDGWIVVAQDALLNNASQIVGAGSSYIKNAGSAAVAVVSGFFTGIFKFTVIMVMAVFFSLEKEKVITVIANVSGRSRAQYTKLKLLKLYKKLGFWLEGQLFLCLCIGIAVWLGLTVIGWFGFSLPDRGTLALIAGLTEFIPYLGPFLGMVPAILIGIASYGFKGLIVVIILYRVIQQTENNILVPLVMNRALGISPLIIFICMIIGGVIFGFLGILMAVPIAVIVNILLEEYGQESHSTPIDDLLTHDTKKK